MSSGRRLIILGRQGAGKGTQCVRLSRHYVVPHISLGDILRAAVRDGTAYGLRALEFMDAGNLVPDDVVIGVIDERLDADHARERGYVLDGFPRTVAQAEALEGIAAPYGIDLVVDLEVPREIVLTRLASRRVCVDCGSNYSVDLMPRRASLCELCGGDLVQRPDDTEDAINRRLDLYEQETAPLVAWFGDRDLLATVDGTGDPDLVTERLIAAVDARTGGTTSGVSG